MASMQSPFVSQALLRLRRSVSICCWIVGVALLLQTMLWAVSTFMDVRHITLADHREPELIVSADQARKQISPLTDASVLGGGGAVADDRGASAVDANRVPTKYDAMMNKASALAMSAGTIAMVLLMPLLALGVLLSTSSATPGVEGTVSAFSWSLVVGLLVLPLGQTLGLPWEEGALASYGLMTQQVDLMIGDSLDAWGTPTFYCRFAVLPMACLVGVTLIGMKFSTGVYAGIIQKERMRLDPVLEKEAANIKAANLHAGRASGAMKMATAAAAEPVLPSAPVAVGNGEPAPPRRLI